MNIPKTLVRFTSKLGKPLYVASCRFRDGDGMKVRNVTFTSDRERAARFHESTADTIANQFFLSVVQTELVDGTLVRDYSPDHAKRTIEHYAKERANAEALDKLFTDALVATGINIIDLLARQGGR
jgi:hypothetical protein